MQELSSLIKFSTNKHIEIQNLISNDECILKCIHKPRNYSSTFLRATNNVKYIRLTYYLINNVFRTYAFRISDENLGRNW